MKSGVSSRIALAFRDHAATKLGSQLAADLFAAAVVRAGGEVELASDARAWVSPAVLQAIADAYEERLGPSFVVDAVTWVVPRRLELSAMNLSAVTTPRSFYKNIDGPRSYFARHLAFSVVDVKAGRAEIAVAYQSDVARHKASCNVARGVLTAIPLLFDLPPSEVEEHECWANGADRCSFVVQFTELAPLAWYGAAVGCGAAAVGVVASGMHPAWIAAPVLGWFIGRDVLLGRIRRHATRVTEAQRRALSENERDFQRRYDELLALNETLEQRVAQRTRELEDAMIELKTRNAALRAALADMEKLHSELVDAGSEAVLDQALQELEHEINNPMSYVLANLEHLRGERRASTDLGELAEVINDIQVGIERIRGVVGWFVSIHKQEETGQLARCDVAKELGETASHLARLWRERIVVHLDVEPLEVMSQGRQLTQVFVNILRNAAEAMGEGNVWVVARRRENRVAIEFRDDGPGIPKEIGDKVFERGFTTKDRRGRGLGLHVCRLIVARHGGSVALKPSTRGAVFEIELPLAESQVRAVNQ